MAKDDKDDLDDEWLVLDCIRASCICAIVIAQELDVYCFMGLVESSEDLHQVVA